MTFRVAGCVLRVVALAQFLATLNPRPATLHAAEASRVAGGVVLSDEWIVRREKGEEEFKGNVRFERGDDLVTTDWALHRRGPDLWKGRGRLYVRRQPSSDETWEVWGDEGEADLKARTAAVRGTRQPLRFRRAPADGSRAWAGTARAARWDERSRRLALDGGVTVQGRGVAIVARGAVFDQAAGRGSFSGGRPVAEFSDARFSGACQADAIDLADSPRRLAASGRVRGWLALQR